MKKRAKNSEPMWAVWNYNIGPIYGMIYRTRKDCRIACEADGRDMKHHTIRRVVVSWKKDTDHAR